jgi:hypothetical protein
MNIRMNSRVLYLLLVSQTGNILLYLHQAGMADAKSLLVSICGRALSIAITMSNCFVKVSDKAQKSACSNQALTLFFAARSLASVISPSLISEPVTL